MRDRVGGSLAGLTEVRQQLRIWREAHGGRGRRLPEEIWDAAVQLAREQGPGVVTRALRLNPDSLSRRIAAGGQRRAIPRRSVFVEVAPIAPGLPSSGCRVELSAPDGSRVAIHLADPGSVDLVALAGGLLRAGR